VAQAWWGDFRFEAGGSRCWHLAGLDLRVSRNEREWQVETLRSAMQHEDEQEWSLDEPSLLPLEAASPGRHLFDRTGPLLRLLPALADRSVVIKPVNPLYIPGGQSAVIFVSTPLWVQLRVEHATTPLADIPVIRPSDTWFGSTPVQGRLCYGTKVFGRTELALLPLRPFRAVTPVTIRNDAADTMPVERICMPVPLLDLYSAGDGRLWTPGLLVDRQAGARTPRVRIDARLHESAGVVRLINRAREQDSDTLTRMFDHLLD